jgi:hypothetical protein
MLATGPDRLSKPLTCSLTINMLLVLIFLALLIATTPIIIIFDGPIIQGLVTAVAAVSVAIVSVRIRPGEAGFLSTVIWPVAVVAAVPALWMLIQLLPLQQVRLAHPIWESAAAALGRPLAGSISIDPGATLISFARYLSVAAIAFVAAAVAVDRRRAEWVLFALTAAATLIALMVLVAGLGGFTFLDNSNGGLAGDAATDSAGLGVILAAAAALHTFEHGKMQRPDQAGSGAWYWPTFVVCLVAVAICSLALIVGATSQAYFAVTCGVAPLAAAVVIRRFRLGPWGISALASITLLVAISIVILQPGSRTVGLTLAFASPTSAPLIAVTQRVLSETSWAGTGAGTFAAILPIYKDIGELTTRSIAPTAAAAIAVEMGRPFLWAILIAAIALVVMLLRGALRRLRDSLFSTAGASCVVAIMLLAFSNAALFSMPVMIIAAVVVGMAIAQSRSRLI